VEKPKAIVAAINPTETITVTPCFQNPQARHDQPAAIAPTAGAAARNP
jgi:hypothetical protein